MEQRLNKYISTCGICSRRNADELIKTGRISVNNTIVTEPGYTLDTERDTVYYDGEKLSSAKKVYYLLNKPRGYVTTTEDEKKRHVVTSLVPPIPKVFPVGRLDINTTGLLLLTNDGDFSNWLLHPSRGHERIYVAVLNHPLDEDRKKQLVKGVMLEKKYSKFAWIKYTSKNKRIVRVCATEGRNHFVKKMFQLLGLFVEELHREQLGPFSLGMVAPGKYIKIPEIKIRQLVQGSEDC